MASLLSMRYCTSYRRFPSVMGLVVVLTMAMMSISHAASLSLQEGVDGYSGTKDTYIVSGGYGDEQDQNYGESPQALVITDRYTPG
jgi:hypothetical protein